MLYYHPSFLGATWKADCFIVFILSAQGLSHSIKWAFSQPTAAKYQIGMKQVSEVSLNLASQKSVSGDTWGPLSSHSSWEENFSGFSKGSVVFL